MRNILNKNSRLFHPISSKKEKRISNIIKNLVVSTIAITSLSSMSAVALAGNEKADINEIVTVYHVYIKDERIGTVKDKKLVEEVIDKKLADGKKQFSNFNISMGNQVTYIPEKVFEPVYNNEKVLEKVKKDVHVQADATALKVDDTIIGYVETKDEAKAVIDLLKLRYVQKNVLDAIESGTHEKFAEELQVGQSKVLDVHLSKEVTYEDGLTNPKDILTIEKAIELIRKGTLEPKKHVIQEGDVLSRVASKYDITVGKILELNPNINEETVLQIGDEIVVMEYKPYLNVVVEEKVNEKVAIPFATEVIEDKNLFKGEMKVQQEGKNGEKSSLYVLTKEDGNIKEKVLLQEQILSNPVKKIIVKGTKVIPSRGTGKLRWPTIGGFVTSDLGYRWGRMHKGIDISGARNKAIVAADNGTVSFAGWDDSGYGNKVVINHNNGMKTVYAHLSSIAVKNGQVVQQGSKIGVMGSTGRSTGVHLHFEVYKDGKMTNPENWY